MSEREKMKAGQWYDANYDEELLAMRQKAQGLAKKYNDCLSEDPHQKGAFLRQLFAHFGDKSQLLAPFYVDYGTNVSIGDDCFINYSAYFMDGAPITIGDHCFIGPFCGFYTAQHHLQIKKRNQGLERALPIKVGANCWLGANVSVMPGVSIGSGAVIGAGSVVTKDIPDNALAVGVPAKVVRFIDQDEDLEL